MDNGISDLLDSTDSGLDVLLWMEHKNEDFLIICMIRNMLNCYYKEDLCLTFSTIMSKYDRVIILGDFNIHIFCPNMSSFTIDFINLVEYFSLTQFVKGPTYCM